MTESPGFFLWSYPLRRWSLDSGRTLAVLGIRNTTLDYECLHRSVYVDYYALEIVVTMLMLRAFADPILLPANCVNLLRSRTIWIATGIPALG